MVRQDGHPGKTFHSRAAPVSTPPLEANCTCVACRPDHGPEELQIQQIQRYLLGTGKLVLLGRPDVQVRLEKAEKGNPKS